jgi:hypothetical protein
VPDDTALATSAEYIAGVTDRSTNPVLGGPGRFDGPLCSVATAYRSMHGVRP